MPELPEVQTVVNDLLAAKLVGVTITHADVFWARSVAVPTAEEFCRRLAGQTIVDIWRRAKYIVIVFANGEHLLIHLRMSGRIHLSDIAEPRTKHEHIVFELGAGRQLRFHDPRKFGRMYLVQNVNEVVGKLGPEPLSAEYTAVLLLAGLHKHQRMLKPLLLDQVFLAGLGNIYVDEALWEARLHPRRLSNTVTSQEAEALHAAIQHVLRRGIKYGGTTLGNGKANFYSVDKQQGRHREALQVFRRTGTPCPRCHSLIERVIVGQRSTHICPVCQTLGAD